MKLLDFPPHLCERVNTSFHPNDWGEFDLTVVWLVKEGVPLALRTKDYSEPNLVVRVKNKRPLAGGKLISNNHQDTFGYVEGEEVGVKYTVYFPDMVRT